MHIRKEDAKVVLTTVLLETAMYKFLWSRHFGGWIFLSFFMAPPSETGKTVRASNAWSEFGRSDRHKPLILRGLATA